VPLPDYPILEVLADIRSALAEHSTAILQAPAGAGKSTVLPLNIYHEPWLAGKKIVMLEPRRLAARAVAHRMSDLLGEEPGQTVGYRIRFETCVSSRTLIEVVTEGTLTRMLQSDNGLEEYGLVIFDEFHERSLDADLALVLCRQAQQVLRPDLRILIMSATLEAGRLTKVLGEVPVVTSSGRQFPVTIRHISPDKSESLPRQVVRAVRTAAASDGGDILAFLPGAAEIRAAASLLESSGLAVHPLYGDLPFRQQQQAILPDSSGRKKVVLATSIAETSLTIEGIGVVVDSGYSRVPKFEPRTGFTRLETVKVTLDSADQRAGRAGRLGPGVCYRLWPETAHHLLQNHRTPEIMEADLAPALLELYQWGVSDPFSLGWITPAPAKAVAAARELLTELHAIESNRITERGRQMLRLPAHPRIAHMLLEAKQHKRADTLLPLAADVAAFLEERDPLRREAGADVCLRVEELRRWRDDRRTSADRNAMERIEKNASAWRKLLRIPSAQVPFRHEDVGLLVMAAYPERVARQEQRHSSRYKLAGGTWARLAETDDLIREGWLAVAGLGDGLKEGRIFLAAPLDPAELLQHSVEQDVLEWDEEHDQLTARRERRVGALVVESKPLRVLDLSQKAREDALLDRLRSKKLKLLGGSGETAAWQARVMSVRAWRPAEGWPDVSEEALVDSMDSWLRPFLSGVTKLADLRGLDLKGMLASMLSWDSQHRLNRLAPSRIEVPSGSSIPLRYFPDGRPPELHVRLQELFGMLETPSVNEGQTKVIVHLLSPGYKPVQVTQNLRSFWSSTYAEVRKELRMRYPKHAWPEDPWSAKAVRGRRT
jgi:ATP-dependent helicase HrpB